MNSARSLADLSATAPDVEPEEADEEGALGGAGTDPATRSGDEKRDRLKLGNVTALFDCM